MRTILETKATRITHHQKGIRNGFEAMAIALFLLAAMAIATPAPALAGERYLHVKVEDAQNGQNVNVNVPLSMAEKILPAINNGQLHNGCVTIHQAELNGIDVRQILDALRTAPDNEFVAINNKKGEQSVRVAKSGGNIVVRIRNEKSKDQTVDVTVPMTVIDALFSTAKQDELNIEAALQSLANTGNSLQVVVHNAGQNVRVWVDSNPVSSGE
jgi:hypothetical protein